jgi:hypothetical protein
MLCYCLQTLLCLIDTAELRKTNKGCLSTYSNLFQLLAKLQIMSEHCRVGLHSSVIILQLRPRNDLMFLRSLHIVKKVNARVLLSVRMFRLPVYYRNADNIKCWWGTVGSAECFETNLILVHIGLL